MTEEDANAAAAEKGCEFTDFLNPDSLKVCSTARVWDTMSVVKPNERFQFERVGYFCVDQDTKPGNIIFNSIVALKESSAKKKVGK